MESSVTFTRVPGIDSFFCVGLLSGFKIYTFTLSMFILKYCTSLHFISPVLLSKNKGKRNEKKREIADGFLMFLLFNFYLWRHDLLKFLLFLKSIF